jgi:hypothetical protein
LPPGQGTGPKKLPFSFEQQQQVPPKTISGRFHHKTCCTSANKQTICWRMQSFGRSIKDLNQNVKFDPTLISRVAVTKYPVEEDVLWLLFSVTLARTGRIAIEKNCTLNYHLSVRRDVTKISCIGITDKIGITSKNRQ